MTVPPPARRSVCRSLARCLFLHPRSTATRGNRRSAASNASSASRAYPSAPISRRRSGSRPNTRPPTSTRNVAGLLVCAQRADYRGHGFEIKGHRRGKPNQMGPAVRNEVDKTRARRVGAQMMGVPAVQLEKIGNHTHPNLMKLVGRACRRQGRAHGAPQKKSCHKNGTLCFASLQYNSAPARRLSDWTASDGPTSHSRVLKHPQPDFLDVHPRAEGSSRTRSPRPAWRSPRSRKSR